MNTDAQWQRDLLDALSVESIVSAAKLRQPSVEETKFIEPTVDESSNAIANIRAWRSYLPEPCVVSMINDGWQWST